MKHSLRRRRPPLASVIAVLALVLAGNLFALDVPPAPTRWYTDTANLLNVTDATALDQKLKAFEDRSGTQFIIYVFPTLGGDPLEDFTIRCAEKWKAGQKKYDNGLILFVAVAEKKTRIEVGYGLEGTITDAVASDVLRNDVQTHFRANDFAGGLNAAADDLIARIEKKEAPVPVARTTAPATRQTSSRGIDPMFIFFILPLLRRGGARRGGCGGCIPLFLPFGGSGMTFGGGGFGGGGGGWGGGGGGGFSGGGGGFGGGGASGGW